MINTHNKWLHAGAELLFPFHQCLLCGKTSNVPICEACAKARQESPWQPCLHCATFVKQPAILCNHCVVQQLPHIAQAIAVAPYEGVLRRFLLDFKYHNCPQLAKPLGYVMTQIIQTQLLSKPDLVTAVPTSLQRIQERGYPQATLLGEVVARELKLPFAGNLLAKPTEAISQTALSRQQRFDHLENIFAWGSQPQLAWRKTILLVDDVFTTGATACHCATLLRKAGAARIVVCTAAAGISKI